MGGPPLSLGCFSLSISFDFRLFYFLNLDLRFDFCHIPSSHPPHGVLPPIPWVGPSTPRGWAVSSVFPLPTRSLHTPLPPLWVWTPSHGAEIPSSLGPSNPHGVCIHILSVAPSPNDLGADPRVPIDSRDPRDGMDSGKPETQRSQETQQTHGSPESQENRWTQETQRSKRC